MRPGGVRHGADFDTLRNVANGRRRGNLRRNPGERFIRPTVENFPTMTMRKSCLFGTVLVGLWALQGCTRATLTIRQPSTEQIIVLTVNDGSGTDLAAADAASDNTAGTDASGTAAGPQSIGQVIVYVVDADDGRIAATRRFNDWPNESATFTDDADGTAAIAANDGTAIPSAVRASASASGISGRRAEFRLANWLPQGRYRLFAVGYRRNSRYGDVAEALTADGTLRADALLTLDRDAGAEELFAGATEPFEVVPSRGFRQEVTLQRQVTGIWLHLRDIPCIEGASRLELVVAAENNTLVVNTLETPDAFPLGGDAGQVAEAAKSVEIGVVNGCTKAAESAFDRRIVTIDLNEWFSSLEDADGDRMLDAATWRQPTRYDGLASFEAGSVFGGAFVIPTDGMERTPTLELRLTTPDGTTVRTWQVELASPMPQTIYAWNGTRFERSAPTSDAATAYPLLRNRLYGLGGCPVASGSASTSGSGSLTVTLSGAPATGAKATATASTTTSSRTTAGFGIEVDEWDDATASPGDTQALSLAGSAILPLTVTSEGWALLRLRTTATQP